MKRATHLLVPFLCALVLVPAFILFHECGHYVAGKWLGFSVKIRHAQVDYSGPKERFTPKANLFISASGPIAGALLGIAGLLWLVWLRRGRAETPASFCDWIATAMALNLGRGLRCFSSLPSNPQPGDEAYISRALGLPGWLLPYGLGVMGIIAFVFIFRLHPRGQRLLPISCLLVGAVIGTMLWVGVAGKMIFP